MLCGSLAAATSLPNFVIMMADDMGYGDWSRTGAPAHTPHLEAMSNSQHAVWFQRAYAGNPICAPTRASVMTGRVPERTCITGVEQHILCRAGVGGCGDGEYTLANATRERGYVSGFYGKWHLGSLSDRGVGSPDCYEKPASESCLAGYVEKDGGCCFGVDGHLDVSNPLHHGFDEFLATPQCAASANSNCGCFFYPEAHNDSACEMGHYHATASKPFTECMQYYHGDATTGSVEPLTYVSPTDDEDFLVDQFESLLNRSLREKKPFLAVIFFHGAHIPYIATPTTRARYAAEGMDINEQDYWGTITQIDAAVGRVRSLLESHGVADNTWVSITADNGPEVNPESGQGTGIFPNPGRTDGLRGRKRDVTEGGTRVIGLFEFPPAVKVNRVEPLFPVSTLDLLPTVLDLLDLQSHKGRPLDGISLLPALRGELSERPIDAGIGIHGTFYLGSTNHVNGSHPYVCPNSSGAKVLGDVPQDFETPGGNPQFSWAEGSELKLIGCKVSDSDIGWNFFMYNLTSDRAETQDLWKEQRSTALAMFARFQQWQTSVWCSQDVGEIGCNANPQCPSPPAPAHAALIV